jgi:hypothetical protein
VIGVGAADRLTCTSIFRPDMIGQNDAANSELAVLQSGVREGLAILSRRRRLGTREVRELTLTLPHDAKMVGVRSETGSGPPLRGLPSRSSRFGVSSRERRMVDQNSASWNPLISWLWQIDRLRRVA